MKRKSHGRSAVCELKLATIEVMIDTPKGSRNKFKFDQRSGLFRLLKLLPAGMIFPYDFGFIPSTKSEDGDPLDVLVLIEEPTFPGCLLECSLVGVIEAQQRKGRSTPVRNDRLMAVARTSLLYSHIENIGQIPATVLKDIEAFFVNYDRLRDVTFKILNHGGPARAREILSAAEAA